jgi:hypothetical protein
MALISLIFAACANTPSSTIAPVEQPDGTFLWNGFELTLKDMGWGSWNVDVTVPENVLTTKDQTITVSFKSRGGTYEYGFNEFIQVYLDGIWYSIQQELSQNEEPLILDTFHGNWIEDDDRTEHTVDLSVIGELPPGKYRLIEAFYEERFKETNYNFAYFWVINPGDKRPPESETTGKARKEDIVLSVQSLYEARRDITDKDTLFVMYIENLSGKEYCIDNEQEKNPPVLEMKQNGKWVKIEYRHVNAGLTFGWMTDRSEFFLDEPLAAGHYRIKTPMQVFIKPGSTQREPGYIEIICEFEVIAYENAPEPKWEVSRLKKSPYDASKQSTGVTMSLTNPVLNKDNTDIEITLTADKLYNYSEPYEVEVLLDGNWYRVPFAHGVFIQPQYTIDPKISEHSKLRFPCDVASKCGILPAGQYRIIKEFTIPDNSPGGVYLAKEFAIADFTVEETLEKIIN